VLNNINNIQESMFIRATTGQLPNETVMPSQDSSSPACWKSPWPKRQQGPVPGLTAHAMAEVTEEDELTRRHEAVVWVRCGRKFFSAKSLAAVVTAGRGVVANNGGGYSRTTAAVCLLNASRSPLPRWVVTRMPVRHSKHFKAD